ncbi:hypothetical protein [Streptomyces sp. NPDC023838]|uniref:hypothetical protein n=1 Tax=Streptomyces sp. NPDC023838 TaxID=3154325 RepID=UPI00340F9C7C
MDRIDHVGPAAAADPALELVLATRQSAYLQIRASMAQHLGTTEFTVLYFTFERDELGGAR